MRLQPSWKLGTSFSRRAGSFTCSSRCRSDCFSSQRESRGASRKMIGPNSSLSQYFNERTACVEDQYAGYAVGDLKVNGKLTLGENIADLGGLKSAFRAWKAYEAANGPIEPAVDGLTNDQLLFVSFAQGWCSKSAPEYLKMMVLSNPHSPPEFRVNGPVTNLSEFHDAFACPVGAPLRPENACVVW